MIDVAFAVCFLVSFQLSRFYSIFFSTFCLLTLASNITQLWLNPPISTTYKVRISTKTKLIKRGWKVNISIKILKFSSNIHLAHIPSQLWHELYEVNKYPDWKTHLHLYCNAIFTFIIKHKNLLVIGEISQRQQQKIQTIRYKILEHYW